MSTNLSPTGGCFAQGEDFRHQRAGAADANEWELDCLLLHSHELKPSRVDSLALPPFEAVCRPSKKSLKKSETKIFERFQLENEIRLSFCVFSDLAPTVSPPPVLCVFVMSSELHAVCVCAVQQPLYALYEQQWSMEGLCRRATAMATTWRIWLGVVVVCLSGRAQLSGSQPLSSSRLLKCTARADALGENACAFPCQLAEFGLSEIAGGSISAQLVVAKPLATCEGPVDAAKGDIRNDEHAHSYEEPPHHHPNALLIGRGGCSFATKALLGRDAYRAAVVIIANTDDDVFPMAGQVDERLNSTLVLMISSGARDRLLKSKSSAPVEATPSSWRFRMNMPLPPTMMSRTEASHSSSRRWTALRASCL